MGTSGKRKGIGWNPHRGAIEKNDDWAWGDAEPRLSTPRCDGSGIVLPRPKRADAMDIENSGMVIQCVWRSKMAQAIKRTVLNDWRRGVEGM